MNFEINNYIQKYCIEIQELFLEIRELILQSASGKVEEKLWAKLPSYYVKEKFIRIIPFKNHINVEAELVKKYEDELKNYNITPKGMLQINLDQDIPSKLLQRIFKETLSV